MQHEWKMKRKIALSIKWDVIRQKRRELEVLHQIKLDEIKRANVWMKIALQFLTIRNVRENIYLRIIAKVKWMKFIFMLNMMKFKIKRKLTKLRPNFESRHI